ncbi:MAG: hypothetical protein AB1641_04775 [Thermodesulfobacteriota bacterium]
MRFIAGLFIILGYLCVWHEYQNVSDFLKINYMIDTGIGFFFFLIGLYCIEIEEKENGKRDRPFFFKYSLSLSIVLILICFIKYCPETTILYGKYNIGGIILIIPGSLFPIIIGGVITNWLHFDVFGKIVDKTKNEYEDEHYTKRKPECGFVMLLEDDPVMRHGFHGALVGHFERFFFTLLVVYDVNGLGIAMVSWLLVKAGSYWFTESNKNKYTAAHQWRALLSTLVSLSFSLIGGKLISYAGSLLSQCCW